MAATASFTSTPPPFSLPSPTLTSIPPYRRNTSELSPWYIPGPSSKFSTKHERSRSQQYNYQRDYTPTAPKLSTALRASHRRVQSSANVPTLASSLFTPSPTVERYAQRSPLSRFSTYQTPNMASYAPTTPSRKTHTSSHPSSKLEDSPFSDYFTDDGRSSNEHPYHAPSPETQQLLVRLSRLQSSLMCGERENEQQTIDMLARKVGEMEEQLSSVHAQTRLPAELEDSGLFMEDEDEDEDEEQVKDETPSATSVATAQRYEGSSDGAERVDSVVTAENQRAESDYLYLEAQKILENVTVLHKRQDELKNLIDQYQSSQENSNREHEVLKTANETLKTENEALRSDFGFDQTELLWLRLQFKALVVEVQVSDVAALQLEDYAPGIKGDIQQVKRERIRDEMERWDCDWVDVYARMGKRRRKYGILGPHEDQDGSVEETGEAQWQLKAVKSGEGNRVQSITITRLDEEGRPFGTDEAGSVGEDGKGEEEEEAKEQLSMTAQLEIVETTPVAIPTMDEISKPEQLTLSSDLEVVETTPFEPAQTYIHNSTQTAEAKEQLSMIAQLQTVETTPIPIPTEEEPPKPEQLTLSAHLEAVDTTPCEAAQIYTHNSTQTEATSSWLFDDEEGHADPDKGEDYCAITTSEEDNFSDDGTKVEDDEDAYPLKTAWQELWHGLANLAGMDEEDE
ncbi:hypothetical protein LTR37_020748 [Vermiconidia calcicola]|uniref:Uncharacterized protein n=1 Tax=Vermiconidia calcicola TaxID=1690605 RepID=A0ACC3MAJ1_9PEZI|nr:hypothetical protein LTR37_020748 [Vermiconidia calcicola]